MDNSEVKIRIETKLKAYQPAPKSAALLSSTPIMLLVGIAGAGKDSIKHELLKTGDYHHIVSHTTRAPRENQGVMEQDGIAYHFISFEEAEKMVDAGAFIEANMVHRNHVYGTSFSEVQAAHDVGKIATTDMEVKGVSQYADISPSIRAVFILPPDYDTWQARLTKRYGGTVDEADRINRMHTALIELDHALTAKHLTFVINDDLSDAVSEINRLAHGGKLGAQETQAKAVAIAIRDKLRLELERHTLPS